MNIDRTRRLSSLLFVAWLSYSQASYAALTCQQGDVTGAEIAISYSDTPEYSRFEFTPANSDEQWVGVVFEFFSTAPANPLLKGLSPSVQGKELTERFTLSFRAHLEETMPYDTMSDIQSHELDGHTVTTFDTVIGEHQDLWAVYGQWDAEEFQFFRAVVPVDGSRYEHSEKTALNAVHQMIRNCLQDEA